MNEWMDEWMNECMNGWMNVRIYECTINDNQDKLFDFEGNRKVWSSKIFLIKSEKKVSLHDRWNYGGGG